jgi:hypothetical protein
MTPPSIVERIAETPTRNHAFKEPFCSFAAIQELHMVQRMPTLQNYVKII